MEQIQKTRPLPEQISPPAMPATGQQSNSKPNQVGTVVLYGIPIVSLVIEAQERLCLAQISNTLLKQFSYNEIHNRRVALGITCVQCTPVQLEILRRAGAMPVSSRRCGMITRREAERLCKSFLGDNAPPRLPEDFAFSVHHECAWGCRGSFLPSRYNSSRAKCIKCSMCGLFFSPNKFIFHSHRVSPSDKYVQPDAANFNSWRRHMKLSGNPSDEIVHAWEDVKAMFNGGTRKRLLQNSTSAPKSQKQPKIVSDGQPSVPAPLIPAPRIPNFQDISLPISRMAMDFMYHKPFAFSPYTTLPWLKRNPILFPHDGPFFSIDKNYQSAFKPVHPVVVNTSDTAQQKTELSDDDVDIETTDDKEEGTSCSRWSPKPDAIAPPAGIPASSTVPEETMSVTPKPEFTTPTDRMWNITRLSFDRMDRNNLLYRHDFQRHFIVGRDEPPISRSPLPATVKPVMDCTACQNHHSSIYPSTENNKLPS